jgi:two-component system, OmpR family, KDP operon response regulator KdpE
MSTATVLTSSILLVDDEPEIRRFVEASLRASGYGVESAATGAEALALLKSRLPSLVVLDLGLPDIDGLDVIRTVRAESKIPLIVLSARTAEEQKIRALDLGADDYLTKPFGVGELLARVRVALRRARRQETETETPYRVAGLEIDVAARRVRKGGVEVRLTPTEFKLLARLVRSAGQVVTHRQLLADVWGAELVEHTHYLRIYMAQLRTKIETDSADPRFLLTDPGVGYRLVDE